MTSKRRAQVQLCAAACCADPRCTKFVYAAANPPDIAVRTSAYPASLDKGLLSFSFSNSHLYGESL